MFSIYEGIHKMGAHQPLADRSEISEVLNLITLQNGADVVVAVKARMTERASAPATIEAINRCERELREAVPQVRCCSSSPM